MSQQGGMPAEEHLARETDLKGKANEKPQGAAADTDIEIRRQAQSLVPVADDSWRPPGGCSPQCLHTQHCSYSGSRRRFTLRCYQHGAVGSYRDAWADVPSSKLL